MKELIKTGIIIILGVLLGTNVWSQEVSIDSLIKKVNIYASKGDSITFYQQVNRIDLALMAEEQLSNRIKWNNAIARILSKKFNATQSALAYINQIVAPAVTNCIEKNEDWEGIAKAYMLSGYLYRIKFGNNISALHYYEKADAIAYGQLKLDGCYYAKHLYKVIGNLYTRQGDYAKAMLYLERALMSCTKDKDKAKVLSDMALCHNDVEEPLIGYQKTQDALKLDLDTNVRLLVYVSQLKSLMKAEKIDLAEQTILEAKQLEKEVIEQEKYNIVSDFYEQVAGWHLEKGDYELADSLFQESISFGKKARRKYLRRALAKKYNVYADLKQNQGNLSSALELCQQGLQLLLPNMSLDTVDYCPDPSQFYSENTFFELLENKADIYQERYKYLGNVEDLKLALLHIERSFLVRDKLRRDHLYTSAQLQNIKDSWLTCRTVIEICIELSKHDEKEMYLKRAFEFNERAKSVLLLAERYEKEQLNQLPDEVRFLLSKANNKIIDAQMAFLDAEEKKRPVDEVYKLKEQFNDAKEAYERQFNEYVEDGKLTETTTINGVSITELQSMLRDNQNSLLSYFIGENNIYTFVVTKDDFNLITVEKPKDFESKVKRFVQSIKDFQTTKGSDSSCVVYTQLGRELYDYLLKPTLNKVDTEQICVIPSGVLCFLPFDALLSSDVQEQCAFSSYPYAILEHSYHYSYSVNLQMHLNTLPSTYNGRSIGFAPEFSSEMGSLSLQYNQELLKDVDENYRDWEIFIGKDASKTAFLIEIENADIFHVATHAQANMDSDIEPFFILASIDGGYDTLYVTELGKVNNPPQMMMLSACETGIGVHQEGEGVMSISRMFMQMGSKSVITTLWQINDKANENIMLNFYENLYSGSNNIDALRAAKKIVITESDDYGAHPVFWAAFTPYGRPYQSPSSKKSTIQGSTWFSSEVLIAAFVGILIAGGVFLTLRKRVQWTKVAEA